MLTERLVENGDAIGKAPLISVIVPIYNVEKYVRKCLDSLVNQTMKEIEVICIDDGSTDKSGEIADEYESQDWPVFHVIHTENRGLSAARNRGIDEAKADWIMFVDSDDWVSPDFCRIPYEAAMEYEADLVIFGSYRSTESGRIMNGSSKIRPGIVKKEDVILNAVAWNKLYKKKLFNDIWYPEGQMFEDSLTTHKVIHNAVKIYRCNKNCYYHRQRRGSISNSTVNWVSSYCAAKQKYNDLKELGYSEEKARASMQEAALNYCGQAASTDDPLYCEAVKTVDMIKGIPEEFSRKASVKLLIWRMNRYLYREIYRLAGRQISRV